MGAWGVNSRSAALDVGSVVLTVLLTVSNTVSMDTVVTTPAEHPRAVLRPGRPRKQQEDSVAHIGTSLCLIFESFE